MSNRVDLRSLGALSNEPKHDHPSPKGSRESQPEILVASVRWLPKSVNLRLSPEPFVRIPPCLGSPEGRLGLGGAS
ncbi:hypothetical protein HW555_014034 [Spodoptera exigua]|uniref:Uncharacterized protein n=1 Tax=Spodoptera exigua TaxID=7107 RepID=A0A835G0E3_SPOEX|nr:hypothetical protein HW555_014034 [Spodoptera exigua]